jgi:hypothetical protein
LFILQYYRGCKKIHKTKLLKVFKYGACGMRHIATKGEVVKILDFTHFSRVFKFNKTSEIGRKKEIFHEIKVSVVMELV